MDISRQRKAWLVFFSVLAIGGIFILVGGVATLDLEGERQPLPRMPTPQEGMPGFGPRSTQLVDAVLRALFVIGGALLPFAIIYYVVSPGARKRLLRDLIAVLIVCLPLYLLWSARPEVLESVESPPLLEGAPNGLPPAPELTFTPEPRQWLTLAAIVTLALLLAAIMVAVGWVMVRRWRRPPASLDQLGRRAQRAIDAIDAGADLRDTITRCYFEMMQVLKEERGIQRQQAMTPREFELQLEQMGVPTTQVRRLTRLFEEVRYGDKQLGSQEERQAVIALTSIVRFSRGGP